MTARALSLAACLLALGAGGCATSIDIFTDGRLEDRCTGAIPACGVQAGCVLAEDEFYQGGFPGGKYFIVRTETERATFDVRTLLVDGTFPGNLYYVRAYDVGCGGFDEGRVDDQNLFEVAGGDSTFDDELTVTGRGDHLVEVFSDMTATFYFTVDVDE